MDIESHISALRKGSAVTTVCGRAFKKILHVLLISLKSTLISRLIEKVGKSHPHTALGIAHKTYYGDTGRSISCRLHHWVETMRYHRVAGPPDIVSIAQTGLQLR